VPDALEALTRINLQDLVGAFGWSGVSTLARAARVVFRGPAVAFARQMLQFDADTGERGLVEAARSAERLLARDVRVYGAHHLPTRGFLALSNHPGLTDTLALFSALGRNDLGVIAIDRPFLLSLANVSRQLFYLPDSPQGRAGLVRQVSRHLNRGGAVLTFPAGRTEPDPAAYDGAVESLADWIDSASVFVRLAPSVPVVPVCVRGVTWGTTAHHPIAGLRRAPGDQRLLASALQLLWQFIVGRPPITIRIQIGAPIHADGRRSGTVSAVQQELIRAMTGLIRNPPEGDGVTAL
jgi:1-acyl-sn-glycerol-3-phosphate acyltransferase